MKNYSRYIGNGHGMRIKRSEIEEKKNYFYFSFFFLKKRNKKKEKQIGMGLTVLYHAWLQRNPSVILAADT